MAKEDNLKPFTSDQSHEQAVINGSKGGIASGKARREKATFKNAIKWLIESDIKINKGNLYESFKQSGIDISKLNTTQLATLGLWSGAVQGNATNYKTLMEANEEIQTDTETPAININIIDNEHLEKVMYSNDEEK